MVLRTRSSVSFVFLVIAISSLLVSVVSAAKATSFCKCTCGSNSTIFALRYEPPTPLPPDLSQDKDPAYQDPPPHKTGKCTDCNRSYCLEQKVNTMPICDDTKDEEIFTDCFQRDSAKDEAIIYGFIVLTVGLLVYGTFRPWARRRAEALQERRTYSAVPSGQGPS